jgi:hypothetical protein
LKDGLRDFGKKFQNKKHGSGDLRKKFKANGKAKAKEAIVLCL